jgi:hypothetical protein
MNLMAMHEGRGGRGELGARRCGGELRGLRKSGIEGLGAR